MNCQSTTRGWNESALLKLFKLNPMPPFLSFVFVCQCCALRVLTIFQNTLAHPLSITAAPYLVSYLNMVSKTEPET